MHLFSAGARVVSKDFFLPLKTEKNTLKIYSFFSVLPTGPKSAQLLYSVP